MTGTDAWDRVLTKHEERPEISEQLQMLRKREDRNRRLTVALVIMSFGVVFLVAGALLIGDWSDSLATDLMADRIRLEVGVLLVAIGSVVLSAVLTYLMPKFRN